MKNTKELKGNIIKPAEMEFIVSIYGIELEDVKEKLENEYPDSKEIRLKLFSKIEHTIKNNAWASILKNIVNAKKVDDKTKARAKEILRQLEMIIIAKTIVKQQYKEATLKKSFDGSQILKEWFSFNEREKNLTAELKRKSRNILTSWSVVSMGKDKLEILEIKKNGDANDYLFNNRTGIISYWINDIGINDFLFTSMVFYLCKMGCEKYLDSLNIIYKVLYHDKQFKGNVLTKFGGVEKFMNFNEEKPDERESKKYENKMVEVTAMQQKINDYRVKFSEIMEGKYFKINFIKGSEYKRVDGAHIVEVKEIKENHITNLEWIKDYNNGVYIEPNIHRMWDKYDIYLDTDYKFKDYSNNNIVYVIKDEFKNNERTNFIQIRKDIDLKRKKQM